MLRGGASERPIGSASTCLALPAVRAGRVICEVDALPVVTTLALVTGGIAGLGALVAIHHLPARALAGVAHTDLTDDGRALCVGAARPGSQALLAALDTRSLALLALLAPGFCAWTSQDQTSQTCRQAQEPTSWDSPDAGTHYLIKHLIVHRVFHLLIDAGNPSSAISPRGFALRISW